MTFLVVLLLSGCPKPSPSATGFTFEPPSAGTTITAASPLAPIASPGRFEGQGLAIDVPAGFVGHVGDGDLAVVLRHVATGVEVEVQVVAAGATFTDCDALFADNTAWRDLPGLTGVATATCLPTSPTGNVTQMWTGVAGDRGVRIVVRYPNGRLIEGRQAIDPILASIRRSTGDDG